MSNNIIKNAKKYVNRILTPLNNHYYHSYEHAIDVMHRAVYLAEKEGLNTDEIEILALAGLFHDTGFIIKYDKNESIGANIAKNYLKTISYPDNKIKIIKRIILATDPDYKTPKDIYEKIIKDADMDNLGREDFFNKSNNIKKEIETVKKIKIKDPEWNHSLVDLLIDHRFKTDSQKKERNKQKRENLANVLQFMKDGYIKTDKDFEKYMVM